MHLSNHGSSASRGGGLRSDKLSSTSSMSSSSFVSHIIYPTGTFHPEKLRRHSFIVGWNLENFRCSIACLIELPAEQFDDLSSALEYCADDLFAILSSCSKHGISQPIILGEVIPHADSAYVPSSVRQASSIWLTLTSRKNPFGNPNGSASTPSVGRTSTTRLTKGGRKERASIGIKDGPELLSLYSLGCRYETSCYMFDYDLVNTNRLECLHVFRDHWLHTLTSSAVTVLRRSTSSVQNDDYIDPTHRLEMKGESGNQTVIEEKLNDSSCDPNTSSRHTFRNRNITASSASTAVDTSLSPSTSPKGIPNNDPNNDMPEKKLPRREMRHQETSSAGFSKTDLEIIVAQINASYELQQRIMFYLSELGVTTSETRTIGTASGFWERRSSQVHEDVSSTHVTSGDDTPEDTHSTDGVCNSFLVALCRLLAFPVWLWYLWLRILNYLLNYKFVFFTLGNVFAEWLGLSGTGGILGHSDELDDTYRHDTMNRSSGHQYMGDIRSPSSSSSEDEEKEGGGGGHSNSGEIDDDGRDVSTATLLPSRGDPHDINSSNSNNNSSRFDQSGDREGLNQRASFAAKLSSLPGRYFAHSKNVDRTRSTTTTSGTSKRRPTSNGHSSSINKAAVYQQQRDSGISLKEFSLSGAYLSERATCLLGIIQKCALFPISWGLPSTVKQYLWVDVCSTLCWMWIDVMLGSLLGYYVNVYAEVLLREIGFCCSRVQSRFILGSLDWFNHSPGGVKLHPLITRKMGKLLQTLIYSFSALLDLTRPLHLFIIRLIACCGTLGITVQLVLLVDLLRLLTIHIALIHRALSVQHRFQLQSIRSLWLLFMGQKKNILRRRVDTAVFDQSQLLFGIVVFAFVLFLLPNFAAYFLLFAVAQLGSVSIQYALYACSLMVKEFPYFMVSLKFWNPEMVSDGVTFSILPLRTRDRKFTPASASASASFGLTSKSAVHPTAASSHTASTSAAAGSGSGSGRGRSAHLNSMSSTSGHHVTKPPLPLSPPPPKGILKPVSSFPGSRRDFALPPAETVKPINSGISPSTVGHTRRVSFHCVTPVTGSFHEEEEERVGRSGREVVVGSSSENDEIVVASADGDSDMFGDRELSSSGDNAGRDCRSSAWIHSSENNMGREAEDNEEHEEHGGSKERTFSPRGQFSRANLLRRGVDTVDSSEDGWSDGYSNDFYSHSSRHHQQHNRNHLKSPTRKGAPAIAATATAPPGLGISLLPPIPFCGAEDILHDSAGEGVSDSKAFLGSHSSSHSGGGGAGGTGGAGAHDDSRGHSNHHPLHQSSLNSNSSSSVGSKLPRVNFVYADTYAYRSKVVNGSTSGVAAAAYIGIEARPMKNARLFQTYLSHMFYFYTENKRGILARIWRGVIYGHPALDIQLIHGTNELARERETQTRRSIRAILEAVRACAKQWRHHERGKNHRQDYNASTPQTLGKQRHHGSHRDSPLTARTVGREEEEGIEGEDDGRERFIQSQKSGSSTSINGTDVQEGDEGDTLASKAVRSLGSRKRYFWDHIQHALDGQDCISAFAYRLHESQECEKNQFLFSAGTTTTNSSNSSCFSGETSQQEILENRRRRRRRQVRRFSSRKCRDLSRQLLLLVLLSLALNALICLIGTYVFFASTVGMGWEGMALESHAIEDRPILPSNVYAA